MDMTESLTPLESAAVEAFIRATVLDEAARNEQRSDVNKQLCDQYNVWAKKSKEALEAVEAEWRAAGGRPVDYSVTAEGWTWRVAEELGVFDESGLDVAIGVDEVESVISRLRQRITSEPAAAKKN